MGTCDSGSGNLVVSLHFLTRPGRLTDINGKPQVNANRVHLIVTCQHFCPNSVSSLSNIVLISKLQVGLKDYPRACVVLVVKSVASVQSYVVQICPTEISFLCGFHD